LSLDYAGINILAAGSIIPIVYYGMYCSFDIWHLLLQLWYQYFI